MLSCSLSVMDGLQRLYIKGKAKNAQTHKRTKFVLAFDYRDFDSNEQG